VNLGIFILALSLIIPLGLIVSWQLWPYRHSATVRLLFGALFATIGWCLGYACEILAVGESSKLLWAMAQYPFIGLLPVSWLGLAMTLWRNGRPPARRLLLALAILPVLIQPLVWTNGFHHLIWSSYEIRSIGELHLLVVDHGPAFWLFNVYCLVLVGVGLLIMLLTALRSGSIGMSQRLALAVAALLPAIGNVVYTTELGWLPGLDLTPFAFALSILAVSHATYGRGIINIVLMARDAVLEQLPDAVFVLNAELRVVDANQSARTLASVHGPFHIGQPVHKLLPFLPEHWQIAESDEVLQIEAPGADGSPRIHRFKRLWLRTQDTARPAGQVVIASDITREEQSKRRLEEARQAAEAANIAKSRFLANMSHEIRTPLNGILGMAQLLRDEPLDAESRRYVDVILSSGDALLGILNDVLDMAKADSGTLELHPQPVDPRALLDDVCALHDARLRQKKLSLRLDIAAELPPRVLVDGRRLKQMLFNLLNNAIKFTETGEIGVSADWLEPAEGKPILRLRVRDTGIGIAEADQDKVFGAFEQADASTTRRFGGTGLGLAIVRQLAEMMGGRVSLQSEPGRGSTFTLELPIDRCQ